MGVKDTEKAVANLEGLEKHGYQPATGSAPRNPTPPRDGGTATAPPPTQDSKPAKK